MQTNRLVSVEKGKKEFFSRRTSIQGNKKAFLWRNNDIQLKLLCIITNTLNTCILHALSLIIHVTCPGQASTMCNYIDLILQTRLG